MAKLSIYFITFSEFSVCVALRIRTEQSQQRIGTTKKENIHIKITTKRSGGLQGGNFKIYRCKRCKSRKSIVLTVHCTVYSVRTQGIGLRCTYNHKRTPTIS